MTKPTTAKLDIENIGQPGKTYRVDAEKYAEMRRAVLAHLPDEAPGMTPAALIAAVTPGLDPSLFPAGQTAGWWVKAVHLDLEAKRIVIRAPKSPVRLWRL